jgi:hypothetical protein
MAAERTERIRQDLERVVSDETATHLMDRPPGGWSELVTRDVLDDKIAGLEHRMDAIKFEILAEMERRFRAQTWFLASAMITGLGIVGAIVRI